MDKENVQSQNKSSYLPGSAILGCFIVGIVGLVFGAATGGGGLIASAIAFGLAANAILRE